MVENFTKRILDIRHKVFTKKDIENFVAIFDAVVLEMGVNKGNGAGSSVDKFYEIQVGAQMYSGESYAAFKTIYEADHSADYILWSASIASSVGSMHAVKERVRLMLDRRPNTASYVEVLGPNEMWVSGTFQRFIDGLIKVPSRNSIIRSETVNILVQLAVVLVATGTALGAAELVGSTSARTNAPVYAFVVVFACLITVSGQLQRVLYSLRDRYYPQLDIRSSPRERITFNVMSLIVTTGAGWAIKKLLDFIFG